MSAISWNCRGLGNPFTVKALHKVVREEDPTLVFLMETKHDVTEMKWIQRKLDRKQGLVVPRVRRGGGLALLWRSSTTVEVQTYSPNHIDAIISEGQGIGNGGSPGFMATLKLVDAVNHGLCSHASILIVTSLGCVWGTIMNSCLQVRRRVAMLKQRVR